MDIRQTVRVSRREKRRWAGVLFLALLAVPALVARADPTTVGQAQGVVKGWLALDSAPMETVMGQQVDRVEAYEHPEGGMSYYVVYLDPSGFVIVSADDCVQPIVAFAPAGHYDPSEDSPLGALVTRDLAGRVAAARAAQMAPEQEGPGPAVADHASKARNRWRRLECLAKRLDEGGGEATELRGISSVSTVHVAPLIKSRWSQGSVGGKLCYNYFTPNNSVCGCVATAMAQVMRFYRRPGRRVGQEKYIIYVNGVKKKRALRGGDGKGGKYHWKDMVYQPSGSSSTGQRKAIGALCHDAGVAAHMQYTSSSSGAYMSDACAAMLDPFSYSQAVHGRYSGYNIPSGNRNCMLNASVAARCPAMLGIYRTGGGHAVVCDGYGYQSGTMYHHINMGWAGSYDAWYNLPTIAAGSATYTSLADTVYNVFKGGSGEIISGRVTDKNGQPINRARVIAKQGSTWIRRKRTNQRGVYAFPKLASKTRYTVKCSKKGHSFSRQRVKTGESKDAAKACGNKWKVNFKSTKALEEVRLQPESCRSASRPACELAVSARDAAGQALSGVAVTLASGGSAGPAVLATAAALGCEPGSVVTLTAPKSVADGERVLAFERWELDGEPAPGGEPAIEVEMSADRAAVAVYRAP